MKKKVFISAALVLVMAFSAAVSANEIVTRGQLRCPACAAGYTCDEHLSVGPY